MLLARNPRSMVALVNPTVQECGHPSRMYRLGRCFECENASLMDRVLYLEDRIETLEDEARTSDVGMEFYPPNHDLGE